MTESYHIPQSPMKKFCPRCCSEKPLIDFRRARSSPDGYQNVCKLCCGVHLRWSKNPRQLPLFVSSKVCAECGEEKSIEQFSRNKDGVDGYKSQCNQCRKAYNEIYYKAHHEKRIAHTRAYDATPERIAWRKQKYQDKYLNTPELVAQGWEALHKWQKDNPLRAHERLVRRRAIKKNTTVDIVDYTAILDRDGYVCHICNQPIDPAIKKGRAMLTFDHVIPLQPKPGEPQGTHTADNIKPAHKTCNQRKSNRSFESLTDFHRRGL